MSRSMHFRSAFLRPLVLAFVLIPSILHAQIPRTLSYQGILSDTLGTPKPDGQYAITFRLYNVASGGTALWSETQSLQVRRGLFSAILGSQTPFPSSLTFDRQYWLSIQPASEPELAPRIPLSSVGYSLNAARADTARYAQTAGSGGGGLTLPYAGTGTTSGPLFSLTNLDTAGGSAIHGRTWSTSASAEGYGVIGEFGPSLLGNSARGAGVLGVGPNSNDQNSAGVLGLGGFVGVKGQSFDGPGVLGTSELGDGVIGYTSRTGKGGIRGWNDVAGGVGVWGTSTNGIAVSGASTNGWAGVFNGRVSATLLQITGGSDLAEPFDVGEEVSPEPGTVVSIDPENPGKLIPCEKPYDTRVAGIVSGAGNIRPGLTLRQDGVVEGKSLVAIAGRVYCKAEAETSPIMPGDLLTTSPVPGHAMKASDAGRSHGAIIGKAMTRLEKGRGLVLVLVNLQ